MIGGMPGIVPGIGEFDQQVQAESITQLEQSVNLVETIDGTQCVWAIVTKFDLNQTVNMATVVASAFGKLGRKDIAQGIRDVLLKL